MCLVFRCSATVIHNVTEYEWPDLQVFKLGLVLYVLSPDIFDHVIVLEREECSIDQAKLGYLL